MSLLLESLRYKPVGFWNLDSTSPFPDVSSYGRTGSASGAPKRHISLVTGALYSSVFSRKITGSFPSPIFKQGKEKQPFTLGANVKTINTTIGNEPLPYRENIFTQPGLEGASNFWSSRWFGGGGGAGSNMVTTDGAIIGAKGWRKVWTTADNNTEDVGMSVFVYNIEPGETYTFSGYSRASWAVEQRCFVDWYDSNNNTIGSAGTWAAPYAANAVVRHSVTSLAPATAVRATFVWGPYSNGAKPNPVNSFCDFDAVLVEKSSTLGTYFDGSIPGYEWTGEADNSVSRTRTDVSRVNLHPNPSVENNMETYGSANGATTTRQASSAIVGTQGVRVSCPANGIADSGINISGWANLVAGRTYTGSVSIRAITAGTYSLSPQGPSGNGSIRPSFTMSAGEVKRQSVTWTATGTGGLALYVLRTNGAAVADFDIDGVLIEETNEVRPYFDGNTLGAEWSSWASNSWSYMLPSNGPQQILGNSNKQDGLIVDGTKISFVLKFANTGEVRATYDQQVSKNASVYGVYNGDKVSLYVDGVLVDEEALSEAQRLDTFAATDGNLYTGSSTASQEIAVNSVGIYATALSGEAISVLAKRAKAFTPSIDVAEQYGGVVIPMARDERDIYLDRTWATETQWKSGVLEDVVVQEDALRPTLENGISVRGNWRTSIQLESGTLTSIYGLVFDWYGEGAVVEASLDGTAWETLVRGQRSTLIPAGFNPAEKTLQIRVSFPGGVYDDASYIDNLNVIGLITGNALTANNRKITTGNNVSLRREFEALDLRDNWGARISNSQIIIEGGTPVRTIEVWIKPDNTVDTTFNVTGASLYQNGVSSGYTLPGGQWTLYHVITSADVTGQLVINTNGVVGRVVLYGAALSAAEITKIYNSYTNNHKVSVRDNSVIGVTESLLPTKIYARDWSVTPSG